MGASPNGEPYGNLDKKVKQLGKELSGVSVALPNNQEAAQARSTSGAVYKSLLDLYKTKEIKDPSKVEQIGQTYTEEQRKGYALARLNILAAEQDVE